MSDAQYIETKRWVLQRTNAEVAIIAVGMQGPAGTGGGGGGSVDSVNGHTGTVVLGASDVGAQPVDSDLTAIAALTTTTFGRALLTLANAAAGQAALGLGTAATQNTSAFDAAGAAAAVAATLGSAATHAATDFDAAGAAAAAQAASQPLDSDLTAIAALSTTAFGRALLALADAAALRSAAALGGAATLNVGTTTGTVAAGDDARMTNARAPSGSAGGDLTGTYPNPTLASAGPGATGPIGDGTHVPVVTIDAKGRVTALTSTAITGGGSADKLGLTPTAVKTANYTAAAGDFVPCDLATTGSFTLTFPTAPADGTVIAAKIVATSGARTLTLALGGSDVFNVAGGATSGTLSLLNQAGVWQYKSSSAIWYTVAAEIPLTAADSRYVLQSSLPLAIGSGGTGQATQQAALDALAGAVTANRVLAGDGSHVTLRALVSADIPALSYAPANPLATDTLWDAAGDLVVGTGADTAAKLTVDTAAGKALASDPNATNKLSWQYPQSVQGAYAGQLNALAATLDRGSLVEANLSAVLTSGALYMVRVFLVKGMSLSTISFMSGTTAGSGMTNQWFGLFDANRNRLALTGDDTSTAWAANTMKTLSITGAPYVVTATGMFYLGCCVVGTTPPSLRGLTSTGTTVKGLSQSPVGVSSGALTNPASCPSPCAAVSANSQTPYAEVA